MGMCVDVHVYVRRKDKDPITGESLISDRLL